MIEQHESDKCCTQCHEWKPATAFHRRGPSGRRHSWCAKCKREADDLRYVARQAQKSERPAPAPECAVPLPAMDLLEQLACIALRKWRYPVNETTRFGVAMIGGGYV